jgi:hypothetical protein
MPEISRFWGIIIRMYADEHAPPHFHAYYQDDSALFSISSGQIIEGDFPKKQSAFVTAWALKYQEELTLNWESLIRGKNSKKIKPLQ